MYIDSSRSKENTIPLNNNLVGKKNVKTFHNINML